MKRRILTVLLYQDIGSEVDVEVGGYFFTMSGITRFKRTINGGCWGAAALVFVLLVSPIVRAGALEDGIAAYDNRNFVTAATKWRDAAEAGNAEAQRRLADLLASDDAFLTGTFTGPLEDGALAYERKDFSTAALKFREAAEQGNSEAQRRLGDSFYRGLGVPKDDNAAEAWWRKAAEQGNNKAAWWLWLMPHNIGVGPQPSHYPPRPCDKYVTEAVKWWRKAAEQGDIEAQKQVARSYYYGWCLETNKSEAFKWIRRAAEQGDADAQYMLAKLYLDGIAIKKDATLALRWWRKAAEQNDQIAQLHLAEALWNGDGVQKNPAEAVRWFLKVDRKFPYLSHVQYTLGIAYLKGEGVPQDYKRAFDWFMKAAIRDDRSAQKMVGLMYVLGQGVPQDYVQAHMWLNLAAAKGTTDAADVRENVAESMTPAQIAEAQRLAREWKPVSP